jgi:hypothetical protein
MIYIDCHNGRDHEIVYPIGAWDKAKKEYDELQMQMHRCQKALSTIPPVKLSTPASNDSDSNSQ